MIRQIECIIFGRVQGKSFRAFARRKAISKGLVGVVENLSDGTVHLIAQGDQFELEKFVQQLRRGSLFSRVDSVDVKWSNAVKAYSDFTVIY